MYRNFYSYNDMPQIAQPPQKHPQIAEKKTEKNPNPFSDVLKNLKNDDIILIIVILLLLFDGCDDLLLLIAIGFIFISGFNN